MLEAFKEWGMGVDEQYKDDPGVRMGSECYVNFLVHLCTQNPKVELEVLNRLAARHEHEKVTIVFIEPVRVEELVSPHVDTASSD